MFVQPVVVASDLAKNRIVERASVRFGEMSHSQTPESLRNIICYVFEFCIIQLDKHHNANKKEFSVSPISNKYSSNYNMDEQHKSYCKCLETVFVD